LREHQKDDQRYSRHLILLLLQTVSLCPQIASHQFRITPNQLEYSTFTVRYLYRELVAMAARNPQPFCLTHGQRKNLLNVK
ncbi:hypothetical protein LCGC14_3017020, partial [marine sediment metagenome]